MVNMDSSINKMLLFFSSPANYIFHDLYTLLVTWFDLYLGSIVCLIHISLGLQAINQFVALLLIFFHLCQCLVKHVLIMNHTNNP